MIALPICSMPVMWLGLDPSLTAFGFSVMGCASSGPTELLALGTWYTEKDREAEKATVDTNRRFAQLAENLKDLLDVVSPQVVFVEGIALIPKMGVFANTIKGRLRGIIEGMCIAYGTPLESFHPQQLRRHLGLEQGATKADVEGKLRARHGRELDRLIASEPRDAFDDNALDAAAIAMLGGFHDAVDWHRRKLARQAL